MEKKKKSKIQQGMLNRYRMIFIIIALFAILIATMLFKTTVVDAPLWNEKAAGTLVSGDSITPERGKILASDGSILSVSVRYYMVRLDLRSPNFKPEAIDRCCRGCALSSNRCTHNPNARLLNGRHCLTMK